MSLKNTTPTPNVFYDTIMETLSRRELLLLLLIIRQTWGWTQTAKTKTRKQRARITVGYFCSKTGLSRSSVYRGLNALQLKNLIRITDYHNYIISEPIKRKGKSYLYYSFLIPNQLVVKLKQPSCKVDTKPVADMQHDKRKKKKNKRNVSPETENNSSFMACKELIAQWKRKYDI